MAVPREIELLDLTSEGKATVKVLDTDELEFEYTILIPREMLQGTDQEVALNIKDFLESKWPTENLANQRFAFDPVAIKQAIGPRSFRPTGTPEDARRRLANRLAGLDSSGNPISSSGAS